MERTHPSNRPTNSGLPLQAGRSDAERRNSAAPEETGVTEGTVRGIFSAYVQQLGDKIKFEMHKIQRPKFERKSRIPDGAPDYGVPEALPPGRNLGTDVATLITMLEADSL